MKKFLMELIKRKKAELEDLKTRSAKSENLEEVRSIGTQIEAINEEIRSAEAQLKAIEDEEKSNAATETEEARSAFNPNAALNVLANVPMNEARNAENDPLSTMEYRKAFKDYATTGVRSEFLNKTLMEVRNDAGTEVVSSELGVLLPNTIIQEIMKGVEKVRGNIYSKVRKLNIKGGVQFPIGEFEATFYWGGTAGTDTEHGVSPEQDAGEVNDSVIFAYHIGEIRIAQSLLQSVLTIEAFEKEIINALVEAYVTAMDKAVMFGTGVNQPTGILTNVAAGLQRIPASNIIEFTEDEMKDWTKWESKFFAQIPMSLENSFTEFVMAKQTYVSNLCTMKDNNNQPINKAGFDVYEKQHKFNEYPVNRVEKDIFKDFDSCTNGEYFGMFWLPEKAYAVNTNMQFGYKKYFDEATNKYINKGLVIVDGKILDPKYIYLLKKKVQA